MVDDIEQFYQEFLQDVYSSADADGRYTEDAFFERFCTHLIDAGELETADRAHYLGLRGLRVDGYGGDPLDCDGILSLIVADFSQDEEPTTLTATEMNAIFNRATNFLQKSLDSSFRERLEETTAAFGLADLIAIRWGNINRVRILLVSNRTLSTRVDSKESGKLEGVPISFSVWDLQRLYQYVISGNEREDIEINLAQEFGGPLPALRAAITDTEYDAYLTVIPAEQLASIYERWGVRLLEQNVRVFLQARGKVNKGIRITLESDPVMFFAYNNGLAVTAESVMTREHGTGLEITGFRNLQIVNGGQTTASIHAASKKNVDLSRVFVQMKVSIVERSQALEIVPQISEYANSQNRVNAADFFANHPFHVRFEGFSRRIYAPSPDGTFRQSKWFYERARGQYQDARARLTQAQRKKFDLEYPKRQMFTKTDLAKFLMVWWGRPHTVSMGAQKNFGKCATIIGEQWDKKEDSFNELFYRQAIAKAIIFRHAERLVTAQPWYEGGYRANIVAYTIAKIGHDTEVMGGTVDLDRVWREQAASPELDAAMAVASKVAHDVLTEPPAGIRNVTEWAKKEACWKRMCDQKVRWPRELTEVLASASAQKQSEREAVKEQRMLNGIEAQTAVVDAGAAFWKSAREWGMSRKLLTPTEAGVLDVASVIPAKIPTEKQSVVAVEALRKLQGEGCQLRLTDAHDRIL